MDWSNRWAHSAMRQWLNTLADSGAWWTAKNYYWSADINNEGCIRGISPDYSLSTNMDIVSRNLTSTYKVSPHYSEYMSSYYNSDDDGDEDIDGCDEAIDKFLSDLTDSEKGDADND